MNLFHMDAQKKKKKKKISANWGPRDLPGIVTQQKSAGGDFMHADLSSLV